MSTWYITQGDTYPPLTATLRESAEPPAEIGDPVDLTGSTVRFSMRSARGALVVDRATCIITDADAGEVLYQWTVLDTASGGDHTGEFEETRGDGTIRTYPNDRTMLIIIRPQLR